MLGGRGGGREDGSEKEDDREEMGCKVSVAWEGRREGRWEREGGR